MPKKRGGGPRLGRRTRLGRGRGFCFWFSLPCLSASDALGFVLAWFTGASKSPLGSTVAPLIFGIIAALGVKESLKGAAQRTVDDLSRDLGGSFNCRFLLFRSDRLQMGHQVKNAALRYGSVSSRTKLARLRYCTTKIHAFRTKARVADLSYQEYEAFMREVIRPIIEDEPSDRLHRLTSAVTEMEAAFPKPQGRREA